jgi:hypothetical protein
MCGNHIFQVEKNAKFSPPNIFIKKSLLSSTAKCSRSRVNRTNLWSEAMIKKGLEFQWIGTYIIGKTFIMLGTCWEELECSLTYDM